MTLPIVDHGSGHLVWMPPRGDLETAGPFVQDLAAERASALQVIASASTG